MGSQPRCECRLTVIGSKRDVRRFQASAWEKTLHVRYALPSLDEIDVLFKSAAACIAVEVKSAISDHLTTDYERGLYQTVKYRALLEAMSKDRRYDMPANIRVVLVLESKLPAEYKSTAEVLGVELIENVQIPKPLKA